MGHTWRPQCHVPTSISQDTGSACRTSHEAEADCKDATHQQIDATCVAKQAVPRMVAGRKPAGTASLE